MPEATTNAVGADVRTIAQFFLLSLALTYNLFSPLAPSRLTGNGFIKLISNLSLGAMVIHLVTLTVGFQASVRMPVS